MKWRWMRPRTATLMLLVALIALGLGGYRAHQAATVRAKIDQAVSILHASGRPIDMGRTDARLGAISSDGAYQTVIFMDIYRGGPVIVTIPLTDRGKTLYASLISKARAQRQARYSVPYYHQYLPPSIP